MDWYSLMHAVHLSLVEYLLRILFGRIDDCMSVSQNDASTKYKLEVNGML